MNTKSEKRQFYVILTIVFLGFFGISLPYLIFPALFLNPLFSIVPASFSEFNRLGLLGITLAAYPFGQFLGSPILGSLSDDLGRKKILTASLLITAISNLATGFAIYAHSLTFLIFTRFLAGIMEGNIAIARAMATDLKSLSKHETFGKINAAASIAYLLGPLVGGLMTDKEIYEGFTTSTPFYFICIFFFVLTFISTALTEKKPTKEKKQTPSVFERLQFVKRLKKLFTNKKLQFLMVTSTCFTLAVDIFYEFGPVYLTLKWGFSPSDLIIYNAVLCLGLAIGNGLLPKITESLFKKQETIIFATGTFSLLLLATLFTDSENSMLALFGFSGLLIGLVVTLLTVKISNTAPENIQGEVLGTQLSLRVFGDAVICLLGGLLLLISPKIILGVASAISGFALSFYFLKRNLFR